jgi:hypothetical protein
MGDELMDQETQDSINELILQVEDGSITVDQFEQIIRDEIIMSMQLTMDKWIFEGDFPLIF